MRTKRFTVTGSGSFPLDMLRYDSCWPEAAEDAAKIEASCRGEKSRDVTINLSTSDRNFTVPTVGRWVSFNWRVVEPSP
jgi:hypothetical protein